MSTRASIVYDEANGVHLYDECLDGTLHLHLWGDDIEFEASPGSIDVTLPRNLTKQLENAVKAYDLLRKACELHEGKEHSWLDQARRLLAAVGDTPEPPVCLECVDSGDMRYDELTGNWECQRCKTLAQTGTKDAAPRRKRDGIEAAKKRIDLALRGLEATIESIRISIKIGDPHEIGQGAVNLMHEASKIVEASAGWHVLQLVAEGIYKNPAGRKP
jgi:hypothetical protein